MNLVDANVLLAAVNEADARHERARGWLDGALTGPASVGFAWVSLLAFLRLSTKVGLFPRPLSVRDAVDIVREWLGQPAAVVVHETPSHLDILEDLLRNLGTGANLTSDAHLAALAIEHRGSVVTFDTDFARFPGVRWSEPAASR